MKRILALFFVTFLIFVELSAQIRLLDTALAGQCHRRASYILANRLLDKLDSAILLSQRASKIYGKDKRWDSYLNSLCVQMNAYALQVDEEKVMTLLDSVTRVSVKIYGSNNLFLARAISYAGLVNLYQSKIDEARTFFQKSYEMTRRILGEEHIEIATIYNNLGNTYYLNSNFEKALDYYNLSLKIRKKLLGDNHLDVAASYNNMGRVFYENSEYDKAIEYFLKDLSITKSLLGNNHQDVAQGYSNVGSIYYEWSNYKKAYDYFQKALEINYSLFGKKCGQVADLYTKIGFVFEAKSLYDTAQVYLQKAADINCELKGAQSIEAANGRLNLGIIYDDKSEYSKALENYFFALSVFREVYGENHLNVAAILNDIGRVYYEKYEFDNAVEFYFKSLAIKRELLGEFSAEVASSYNNLGTALEQKKDSVSSVKYFKRSLEIYKAISNGDQIDVAMVYSNLGDAYSNFGEYKKAKECLDSALSIRIRLFGEDHVDVAMNRLSIAKILTFNKKDDEALNLSMSSLGTMNRLLGDKHEFQVYCRNIIAEIYEMRKEFSNSLRFFQLGLVSSTPLFNDSLNFRSNPPLSGSFNPLQLLSSLKGKSRLLYKIAINEPNMQKKEALIIQSIDCYMRCDTLIGIIRNSITKQSDKLILGEFSKEIYEGAISACLSIKALNPEYEKPYTQLALYFSEQAKNIVLLQSINEAEGIKYANIPDKFLDEEHSLKVKIELFEKKLAETTDSLYEIELRNELFSVNKRYETLIDTLEAKYPDYFNLKYARNKLSLKDIQQMLDKKTAVLDYFLGNNSLFVFTIQKKSFDIYEVSDITGLEDSIYSYRMALIGDPNYARRYFALGKYLFNKLFPINIINNKNINNLLVVPDGCLAFVPFESFPMAENANKNNTMHREQDSLRGFKKISSSVVINNFKNVPFLITRFNVGYFYSLALYCHERDKNVDNHSMSWLAIAPVFSEQEASITKKQRNNLNKNEPSSGLDSTLIRGMMLNGEYINPLPETEIEVTSIQKEFDKRAVRNNILLKEAASERYLKSGILKDYRILHFATHGFVNSEKPELSGILLAQDSIGGQDGILYSGELYNLKIDADLVVLSACETGLGKIKKGEGIIGLTRALLYAGAKNIVVSLWPVSDQSTSNLMIDFYKNLLIEKKSQAFSSCLRQAKLKMIKEGKNSSPFYWSPFIVIGR